MKKIIIYIIASLLLLAMGFSGFKTYENSKSYEKISREIVEKHNVSELSKNKLKKMADMLSLGLYKGYEEVLAEQKKLSAVQALYKQQAIDFTLYFAGAAGLMLLLYFVLSLQEFTIVLSLTSLIALAAGLFTPIMMMSLHKEVQYLGDIVLMTEFKGVLGSITQLFANRDFVVGGALLLFSILFPLAKTLSMLLIALFFHYRSAHTLVRFFKVLGKWSMLDVFVVATFLVYLSAGKGEMSRAEVLAGFYYFLTYVILSMFTSICADKMLRESKTT